MVKELIGLTMTVVVPWTARGTCILTSVAVNGLIATSSMVHAIAGAFQNQLLESTRCTTHTSNTRAFSFIWLASPNDIVAVFGLRMSALTIIENDKFATTSSEWATWISSSWTQISTYPLITALAPPTLINLLVEFTND